jgi:hypothetical protein
MHEHIEQVFSRIKSFVERQRNTFEHGHGSDDFIRQAEHMKVLMD